MNKYQEALNRLVEGNYLTNREKKQFANILQELIDKETPKKPIYKDDGCGDNYYFCGNCGVRVPLCSNLIDQIKYKHCPYCGREIDWSDEDE